MKLFYVGSSRPEEIAQDYLKRGSSVNFAGMTLQNALLDGLYYYDKNISIISAWSITPYPKVKQIWFKPEYINFKGRNDCYKFVGALNLPILNMLVKFINVRRELKKQLKQNREQECNVIVYETYTPFLIAVSTLKKYIHRAVVIIPDLPDYMHGNDSFIRRGLKKINRRLINWCLSRMDGYVVLSKGMLEKLPPKDNCHIVMEGIYNPEFSEKHVEKEIPRTIMYTGGVYRHRGTDLLLEAFSKIDRPNYRLWIRGDGELRSKIVDMAVKDTRIIYFEAMCREELLNLERKATVLVNTTPPQNFTKYFFPSKNMEYLASGTPTIMFRLECIPKEYDEHLFYVDGDDANALCAKILEVCEKPQSELDAFGASAKEFILTQKNPIVQCKRIIEFLKKI